MNKALTIIAFLALLALLAYQSLIAWDVRNVRDSGRAYASFVRDAAASNCLPKDALLETAIARDWDFEDSPQPPFRSYTPKGFNDSIRVFVEPQLNFAKEPGIRFFFDDNGCLMLLR